MNSFLNVLACDIGAGSGRLLKCEYNGNNLAINELSRFTNKVVRTGDSLHWDILCIYRNILDGLQKVSLEENMPVSLGIDTWGNDFALLDIKGLLMENPYSYRDRRTEAMLTHVGKYIDSRDLYARNGIQQERMNSLYQLASLAKDRPYIFDHARHFLFIPDLISFFLTGEINCEYTLATISQLYSYEEGNWDYTLMSLLGIPTEIFPRIIRPGAQSGTLLLSVCRDLGIDPIPLLAVGGHDTASAVAAVPEPGGQLLFISSGTWSIVGTETDNPIINDAAYKYNISNEGGVGNKIRLNKNVMGLWILQEIQRCFAARGKDYSFGEMSALAENVEPFGSVIDPDDLCFFEPTNMPKMVQSYCHASAQKVPETDGEVIRCVLESLALKYCYVVESLEHITKCKYERIHIVGGGSKNELLSQLTADYCSRSVFAGPDEATALGNALVQLISLRELSGLREARALVKHSFPIKRYLPRSDDRLVEHYCYFLSVTGIPSIL
jgi:rhamnulokinase